MKKRNKVTFSFFDVYFFGRCLGSDKVPESGNNPLGMEGTHFFTTKVNIFQNNINEVLHNGDNITTSTPHPKNTSHSNTNSIHSSSHDSIQSILSIDYTTKSLQPLNPKQRIKCLKDAGVEFLKDKISVDEGRGLIKLRLQRQQVGCKCSGKNNCDPEKCLCTKEGIPCQSDTHKFPCKCGPNCGNPNGRRIYSHLRTKYHYQHTFQRYSVNRIEIFDFSNISENGDCKMCNDISDETLKEMFLEPKLPNRKRGANIVMSKKSKEPFIENFFPEVTSSHTSNVFSISSSPQIHFAQSLIYDDLFTFVKSTEKGAEKENSLELEKVEELSDNRIVPYLSPLNERLSLSPIQSDSFTHIATSSSIFNSSWSSIRWSESSFTDQNLSSSLLMENNNKVNQETYWNSFLNTEMSKIKCQSPFTLAQNVLNPISLATEVITPISHKNNILYGDKSKYILKAAKLSNKKKYLRFPSLLMDLNIGTIQSSIQLHKLRRNTIGKLSYFESPLEKNIRKKKTSKMFDKLSLKNTIIKENNNKSINIEESHRKENEEETESLIENIAEISLIKFVSDIPSHSDDELRLCEPIVESKKVDCDDHL